MLILDWFNANSGAISAIATAMIAGTATITVFLTIITVFLTKNLASENRLLRLAWHDSKSRRLSQVRSPNDARNILGIRKRRTRAGNRC